MKDWKFWVQIALVLITLFLAPFLTEEVITKIFGNSLFIVVLVGVAIWVISIVIYKTRKSDFERLIKTIPPELKCYAEARHKEYQYFIKGFKDMRTGKLPKYDYYAILNDSVKRTTQRDLIWACSSCLENEWDENDDNERTLMHNFKSADDRGVFTKRIFILKNNELRPTGSDFSDKTYLPLKNLSSYIKGVDYPYTTSYAIGITDYNNLTQRQQDLLGNGFCAFDFNTPKDTFFIYDTPTETKSSPDLGMGEIIFNESRIEEIRELFNTLTKGKTLKEFVFEKVGDRYVNLNAEAVHFLEENDIS
jgi:hypothetical protein